MSLLDGFNLGVNKFIQYFMVITPAELNSNITNTQVHYFSKKFMQKLLNF